MCNLSVCFAEDFKEIAYLLHDNRIGILFLGFFVLIPWGRSTVILDLNAVMPAKLSKVAEQFTRNLIRFAVFVITDSVLHKKLIELFSSPNIVETIRCNQPIFLKAELDITDVQLVQNGIENFCFTVINRQCGRHILPSHSVKFHLMFRFKFSNILMDFENVFGCELNIVAVHLIVVFRFHKERRVDVG